MGLTTKDKERIDRLSQIDDIHAELTRLLGESQNALVHTQRARTDIERIVAEKTQAFPWLSDAIAQYHEMCDFKSADFLDRKLRPAVSSAERIREMAREKRSLRQSFRLARNRVKYYEALFPWLDDFVGEDLDDLVAQIDSDDDQDSEVDPVSKYLTQAEYRQLTETERNRVALERYWTRKKRPWELGRDYERFIGYLYETRGFIVTYQGIVEGLYDLGRDLIAAKGDAVHVIQCKYWRTERTVREKHIFQLFGTTVEYWLKHRRNKQCQELELFPRLLTSELIRPVFVTSTQFSDEAKEFAEVLGVELKPGIRFSREYPCIKCNVSRKTGEKIYHLPMDQQYDNVIIEPDRGEMYVETVSEAERRGFRRAWRWRGDSVTETG